MQFVVRVVRVLCILLAVDIAGLASAQTPHMRLTVERKVKQHEEATSPQHVFHSGDFIRFRFKSSFDGYLYVTNRSTSGKYTVLFPPTGSQGYNRIERDREYIIPSSAGSWFRVDDPPGFDAVYFLMSPTRLEREAEVAQAPQQMPSEPTRAAPAAELLPRCDDAVFRARGECTDTTAGPRALDKDDVVPPQLPTPAGATPRDITVITKSTTSVVAPSAGVDGPVIYEFRLAHK